MPPPAKGPKRRRVIVTALVIGVALAATATATALWRATPSASVAANGKPRGASTIRLSPKQLMAGQVKTSPAARREVRPAVQALGRATFDPRHSATVGARIRATVREVAKFEGDRVKKGELLAELESSELGSTQASVLMFEAQAHAAERNASREERLAKRGLTTEREVEEANSRLAEVEARVHAAKQGVRALGGEVATPRDTRALGVIALRAPLSGVVVERKVSKGQSLEPDSVAYTIADLDYLWAELQVFERDLAQVAVGQKVELSLLSTNETGFSGVVAHVGHHVDPETRAVPVRVEIDNRDRRLRPGQAVKAMIFSNTPKLVLAVPKSAVARVDGVPTIFVSVGEREFRAVSVTLGVEDAQLVEVTGGLDAGQAVVSEGTFVVKSELFR